MNQVDPIVIGITGASGSILARRTVDELLSRQIPVIAVCSAAARLVWQEEMEEPFNTTLERWRDFPHFTFYPVGDLRAPIASGTFRTSGMAIVPLSMNSMAAIVHGITDNLIRRVADVTLKERRRLVVVPRETPLSTVHLENMLKLSQMGATVLSPQPAFYLRPTSFDEVVDFIVGRTLEALGIPDALPDHLRYQRRSE